MNYRLLLNGKNINKIALNLSWSSNADTLGQQLTFELPFDDTKTFTSLDANVNDKVSLFYKDTLIFFGVIIDIEYNGREPRKCTCLDLAFYLNENKTTIQFNNQIADEAIRELLKRFNIKYKVTSIPVKIDKIYKAEAISDIIKDILKLAEQQLGKKYRFEMRGDTLVVFNWNDIKVNCNVQWIENPQRKLSMEKMKNRVEIVADGDQTAKVVAVVEDKASINKYGLLTEQQTINEEEIAKAKNVAQNLLKELNRIQETGSVSLLGHYEVRAGRIITLKEPITGLQGDYFITDAQHSISNGIHLMSLSLEVV